MKRRQLLMLPTFIEHAESLTKDIRAKLFRILRILSENVNHPSLQTKKVKGAKASVFECRVDQSCRLIYDLISDSIRCWYVGDHDAALEYASNIPTTGQIIADDVEISVVNPDIEIILDFLDTGVEKNQFIILDVNRIGDES